MVNKNFEQNVNSNWNGTNNMISISENQTIIEVRFNVLPVMTSNTGNLGCPCAKELGVCLLQHVH